jgi:ABC-type Fe3+ transport system substrate-binding protein
MKNIHKKMAFMCLAYGMMASNSFGSEPKPEPKTWDDLTDQEKQQLIKAWNGKQEQRAINKGLKKFVYGQVHIFALNQKNADKKAKKLGLI